MTSDFHHPFSRSEGRQAFGSDPARYERARPAYPAAIYDLLQERCGLADGAATLEIGPGPGNATRHLIARGANPFVGVEPDARLARHLGAWLQKAGTNATVHACSFEDADLELGSFDLGVSATAFHWVEQRAGLEKVVSVLRPGGWWAMWWMIFGDPERPDPFHDATMRLLTLGTGDERPRPDPFSLQVEERVADLDAAGFRDIDFVPVRFSHSFTSQEIRDLYASFSPISRIPDEPRERLLDDLARVADDEFGGRVERPLVTACYSAQRPD